MQSDNLIKKMLRSAAICEAAYFGLSFMMMIFSGSLIKIFGSPGGNSAGFGECLGAFLPELARLVLLTAAFFFVWSLFDKAVDPQKYKSSNGIFLVSFVVAGTIVSYIINLLFNINLTRRYGIDLYAQLITLRTYLSFVGYINSAAIVLMWIAFGMEWYRDRLIKEQAMLAAQAAAQAAAANGAQQNGSAGAVSCDPSWDSYRASLINEQAEAVPPQEYIFNNKL